MRIFPSIKELIDLTGINPMGLDWKRFIVAVNDQDEVIGLWSVQASRRRKSLNWLRSLFFLNIAERVLHEPSSNIF